MIKKICLSICAFLVIISPLSAFSFDFLQPEKQVESQEDQITIHNWNPLKGDRIVFDTNNNIGYLIHENNKRLEFPIITGQRRHLYYLGLSYNGATPKQKWVAKELKIQGDKYTYGKEGTFIRLFANGKATHYGIHTHAAEEIMFAREDRYQSMGCPIVKKEILDIIEKTFELNEGELNVWTI
ncbi:MAG: hypothetical protein AAB592_00140 [Patescibacteria group bacterium]